MKKKFLVAILASVITLGCFFVGADYFKSHKINGVLSELEEAKVVIGNEIINNSNVDYYKKTFKVDDSQIKKYLSYVNDEILPEILNVLDSAKYEHKTEIQEDSIVLGLMNNNDTVLIYIYENGDILLNKNNDIYGYSFDKFEDIKKVIDKYSIEISNNPEYSWYSLIV